MSKILVATNNQGKLKEIKDILSDYDLISLKELKCDINVEEDGKTFEENAKKKAKEISRISKMPCISDDSGLCIEAFNGWPGVNTARFLGENSTAKERNEAILEKMKLLKKDERKAKAVCVVVYYENEKFIIAKGEIEGWISERTKGKNGFGFDEIFELENGKTLAELSEKEKNIISQRRIALENLKKQLTNI